MPLRFDGVAKSFGPVVALHATDLAVAPGEFLTLLGPSGSGKTTLLNIAAGYVAPDTGTVRIGARDVTREPARRRNIGMVFQSYALFPHLSVFENIAYGLRVRGIARADIARRVATTLDMVRLVGLDERAIAQLSGGQQQRVALARALVIEPDVLLMDEPMGALDRQLRKHVQLEIRRLHRELGRTTLYVTHDQEEALVMSDRIGVMSAGRIEQIGTPRELYERPANAFVAGFLGESNLLEGEIVGRDGNCVQLALPRLGAVISGQGDAATLRIGDRAAALIRPEAVVVDGDRGGASLPARVAETVFLGELLALRIVLRDGSELWSRQIAGGAWPAEGREVEVGWRREDVLVLPVSEEAARGTKDVDEK